MNGPRVSRETLGRLLEKVTDKENFTLSAPEFLTAHRDCGVEVRFLGEGIKGNEFVLHCVRHELFSKSFMQELPPA